MRTVREVAMRANDWVTWYNYNRPNANSGMEQRVAFLEKANHGALELIVELVDVLASMRIPEQVKIALPTGVILHDDIRS